MSGSYGRWCSSGGPAYQPSACEFQALVRRPLAGAGFPFVEAEGRANHSSKEDFEHDLKRRNGFTAAGFATVHVTWTMALNDPEVFLAEVERARESQLRRRA